MTSSHTTTSIYIAALIRVKLMRHVERSKIMPVIGNWPWIVALSVLLFFLVRVI
jgi:hypothetical protein